MTAFTRDSQALELDRGGRWRTVDGLGQVAFRVMTLWGLASLTGMFERYTGELAVGASEITADFAIDAASVTTGSKRRDRHLRSDAFFDVEQHPEIRFRSASVAVSAEGLLIDGELAIGPVRQTLRIDLALAPGPDGTVSVSGATALDREASGLGRNRCGMLVGDALVAVELVLAPAESGDGPALSRSRSRGFSRT